VVVVEVIMQVKLLMYLFCTYRHDVFLCNVFQISELLLSYISICLTMDVFNGFFWVLVFVGPIVY
jgi:hypothetical protein